MSKFARQVDDFLAEFFAHYPTLATQLGHHAHDASWPDMTESGRLARLDFIARWEARLAALPEAELTPDESIDRDLLLQELGTLRFDEADLREAAWDALSWVYLLGGGLFGLLARDFAPVGTRLASVAGRLEGLADVTVAARATLNGLPDRPVSRLHLDTALRQIPGVGELIEDSVRTARDCAADPVVAALTPRLEAAAARATSALESFRTLLELEVRPRSEGEGRLGARLFGEKMRHTLGGDRSPAEILARAEQEYTAVRAEMIRIASQIWPLWVPDRPLPTPDGAGSATSADSLTVRGVLDAVAVEHPAAPDILEFCRTELANLEAFCRERDIIGLADEPLEIIWTPAFLRSGGGAMLDSPGPLDTGQKSFFAVTPIPEDWTAEQAESYLREDNDRMLRLLTIHEAIPGHYLQLVYSNRCPSLVRALAHNGVFAEGWAVYVTQVLMDFGYRAHDPALLLTHWKFYLRAVTNAIIDVRIHTAGMTEAEAVDLMVEGGFQEEAEARAKWNRARLTSTQLSTYFVGSVEMWDLEREVRERAAIASGDPRGAAAVPPPRVVGGYGPTPGFVYRRHLEAVVAHGTPPIPTIRRILLDPV